MIAKPWRKVLYEAQGFPDNYTDEDAFLKDLRKNVHFREINLRRAMFGITLVTQELCTVVGFVLIYVCLFNEMVKPEIVFTVSSIITMGGFLFHRNVYFENMWDKLGHDLRTVLIFIVFGLLFSPILHTLTDTISTDSIYTMTSLMMFVHLIFFDYGVNVAIVSNSLSLNGSVFAAICLASRLPSTYHAFILITIAIECFVLLPLLRKKIQNSLFITLFLIFSDIYLIISVSYIFTVIFVLTLIFINIICPVLFVKHQKYKENIYGPWDEAVVNDVDTDVLMKHRL